MSLQGRYFDGRSSTSHPIRLALDEDGILSSQPPLLTPQALRDARISSRIGTTPRRISFASGEVIETDQHAMLDAWLAAQGIKSGWLHRLESNSRFVFSTVVCMALLITWTSIWGVPWLSTRIAYALPAEASSYIDRGTIETLDNNILSPSKLDAARQASLQQTFLSLLPEDREGLNYRMVFRDGGYIGANAFALPDGTVLVTDGLIKMAENDEEIISVLLHEIGHVEHRHSLRLIISHTMLAALVVTLTGDINSAGSLVLAMPNILLESSYSRDLEWEADSYALNYMLEHDISPQHFAEFISRLESTPVAVFDDEVAVRDCPVPDEVEQTEESDQNPQQETDAVSELDDYDMGWLNYISSHPPSSERIDRFRTALKTP